MWASIVHYTKLAACDSFGRKAPDVPRRKLRFDDDSLKHAADREKNITSSQSFKDLAEGLVRSVSFDGVKSLGVSFWWDQGSENPSPKRIQRKMRETILVSNELMSFLCGSATPENLGGRKQNKDWGDRKQNILKTIKDACNVEVELRPHLGGEGMQGLAITGKGQDRDRAKRMIVRLGASCRADTLSTVIDSWEDMSSPSFRQVFMSDCTQHEFGTRGFERSFAKVESVSGQDEDVMSFFMKQANHRWRKEMDELNGYEPPNPFVDAEMKWACR
jgi:hypothetical protein